MTKTISIINFKGGVGKTTVTFNLASQLASLGKRVLVIDFDGQGNLTRLANLRDFKSTIINPLSELLLGDDLTSLAIYPAGENLDISPCDIAKEGWQNRAISAMARETIMKRYLAQVKKERDYDYILIDNAPSINLDFQNSLVASDEYLIVTEAAAASADGVSTIFSVINQVKGYFNPDLRCSGIVLNKVELNTNAHRLAKEMIEKVFGKDMYIFKAYLPKSIVASESELLGESIKSHSTKCKLSKAYERLTEEFLKR